MPKNWRKNLLEAIKSEPNVTFIWKYESDEVEWAEGVENIHFSKWVPQTALLNDHRLTAFLTHGGLGSTNELAHLGKPALVIPIFADQIRNANMLARQGGAKVFRKHDLGNPTEIKKAIHSIVFNQKYKENAGKLADLLMNQPTNPKEQVVKYVEFVARFGPFPEMNPRVRHHGFIEKNLLDIYLVMYFPYFVVFVLVLTISMLGYSKVSVRKVKRD
ncbi:hypothetical protein GCK72_020108 [Caenorhabditis remanei]|uniref:UDP-glucuronosyltransferase n=1 Tax=Caenorhabditis remanei TaxID=31234 RepID=A0A6A5GG43_CAERE|nr:hypothetical protein GCK72_020108 [Caenorhabditis remanei]KAF1753551.1 hypothetical protein GCK72_020108 [Caenorhabditis remanei]